MKSKLRNVYMGEMNHHFLHPCMLSQTTLNTNTCNMSYSKRAAFHAQVLTAKQARPADIVVLYPRLVASSLQLHSARLHVRACREGSALSM
jgi:hypothetical protein